MNRKTAYLIWACLNGTAIGVYGFSENLTLRIIAAVYLALALSWVGMLSVAYAADAEPEVDNSFTGYQVAPRTESSLDER